LGSLQKSNAITEDQSSTSWSSTTSLSKSNWVTWSSGEKRRVCRMAVI